MENLESNENNLENLQNKDSIQDDVQNNQIENSSVQSLEEFIKDQKKDKEEVEEEYYYDENDEYDEDDYDEDEDNYDDNDESDELKFDELDEIINDDEEINKNKNEQNLLDEKIIEKITDEDRFVAEMLVDILETIYLYFIEYTVFRKLDNKTFNEIDELEINFTKRERKILISTYSKLVSYYKMSKTSPIYSCLFVTLMIGINKYNYVKRKVKEISNKKFVKKPLDFDDEIMKNFYEYKKQFMTGNLEDEDIYLEDKVSDDGIVDMKKEKRKRGRPRKNEV